MHTGRGQGGFQQIKPCVPVELTAVRAKAVPAARASTRPCLEYKRVVVAAVDTVRLKTDDAYLKYGRAT